MQETPADSKRSIAVAAAVGIGVLVFAGWFFLLPHRLPNDTISEFSSPPAELKAEADEAFERSRKAQEQIKKHQALWEQQQRAQQAEEAKRQEQLDASKQELEAQGFSTTSPTTGEQNDQ